MRITVLAGGVGGARFALGLREAARRGLAGLADARIDIVANTGDDLWLAGLKVCPDLDSLLYALAGVNDTDRGWGRAGDTERVNAELAAFGVGWPWFTLGDLDIGTHIARTSMLQEGASLTEATARLSARWDLGVTLIPVTDDDVPTFVETTAGDSMHFEEWWVRTRASEPAARFVQRGIEVARPAPAALDAIRGADIVLVAPSNPVVSIGTILGIDGIRAALADASAPVVGVSPIIGDAVVRGMADVCLPAIGVATNAGSVGRHYGSRRDGGLLDGWLVDPVDAGVVDAVEEAGIACRAVPLWMSDPDRSAALAVDAIELARGLRADVAV